MRVGHLSSKIELETLQNRVVRNTSDKTLMLHTFLHVSVLCFCVIGVTVMAEDFRNDCVYI